ncbi:MAG: AAA family ATPase [Deltaproteobacteria bacterium]|nr:AAA family ATPase [Deltaproteobacteria bacterium]
MIAGLKSEEIADLDLNFVGRSQVINQLTTGLDKFLGGEGGVCALTGDPGIGKTRLASEFASYARRRGALTLWGRCAGVHLPYLPWIQIGRSGLQSQDEGVRADLRDLAEALTRAVDYADFERLRLFDRITATLKNLARARPLMLIFDDLQVIDELSLFLLGSVARDLSDAGVLILIIYREGGMGVSPGASPLWRALMAQVTSHCFVPELTYPDIARLTEQLTCRTPEPGLVEAFHRKTGGNPRLLEIILSCDLVNWRRKCIEERIPTLLRAAIEDRLAAVSSATRELLSVASVVGSNFDVATLQLVSGNDLYQVADAMAEGERAGVLRRAAQIGGRYQFAVELVRDVLRDGLAGANRERLHFAIAEALETLRERGACIATEDLAFHFSKGVTLGYADKAVEYSRRSASQAIRRRAFHEAARFYGLALSACEFVQNCDEVKRWEILLALAGSQTRSADRSGALASYERALEIAERLGDPERAALATLGLSQFSETSVVDLNAGPHEALVRNTGNQDSVEHYGAELPAMRQSAVVMAQSLWVDGNAQPPLASNVAAGLRSARRFPAALECVVSEKRLDNENPAQTNQIPDRTFRREGEYWTITYEGRVIRIKHCKGLLYIAQLLANPGREFHVTDLAGFADGGHFRLNAEPGDGRVSGVHSDAGPALDATSKTNYRERLRDLREELDEAVAMADSGRTARIQEEIAFLARELARAVGLGGRDRRMSSESERARLRVTNVIRSAIRKTAKQHPALGRYLSISLRTGRVCSFEPDARFPGAWQL